MRTAEIELKFRQMGAEKASVWVLSVHNEKLRDMKKTMVEMAKLIDQLSGMVMKQVEMHSATKSYVDKTMSAAGLVNKSMVEAERIDDEGPANMVD